MHQLSKYILVVIWSFMFAALWITSVEKIKFPQHVDMVKVTSWSSKWASDWVKKDILRDFELVVVEKCLMRCRSPGQNAPVDAQGQRMDRDDIRTTVTQMTAQYNQGLQKAISRKTTRPIWSHSSRRRATPVSWEQKSEATVFRGSGPGLPKWDYRRWERVAWSNEPRWKFQAFCLICAKKTVTEGSPWKGAYKVPCKIASQCLFGLP